MGEADYYLLNGDQEQGPWTLGELQAFLQAGAVTLDTLYARPGMAEWQPLSTILGQASPTAPEPKAPARTGGQPAIRVDLGNAIRSLAKAVEAGVFSGLDDDDKRTMGWMWVGVHDDKDKMCEQCEFYDGQRWTKDFKPVDGGPEFPGKPQLHRGCRCQLVAVDLARVPGPANTKYEDWFRTLDDRSPQATESLYGKAAAQAFRRGEVAARDLKADITPLPPDEVARLLSNPNVLKFLEAMKGASHLQ
jgi:hypothetical protein